jgi:hypothetical protein
MESILSSNVWDGDGDGDGGLRKVRVLPSEKWGFLDRKEIFVIINI